MDPAVRKRMEAMLESLKYPLDQMIDFAIEYTNPSNYEALLEALPLYEAAVVSIMKYRDAMRKGSGGDEQRQRCMEAAAAIKQTTSHVVTYNGQTFAEFVGLAPDKDQAAASDGGEQEAALATSDLTSDGG